MNHATKTYTRQFIIAMFAYAVTLTASISLLKLLPESPWRIPLVLLPVIPVLFGLRAFIELLSRMDELQQRIQLQGIAFAAGTTGMLTFTYGFLELIGFPPISWLWIFPLMIVLWGFGLALATRKYQ